MGCSPEARLHGASAGRICVFALIGLQAERLMGGPDADVNRTGLREPLEVSHPLPSVSPSPELPFGCIKLLGSLPWEREPPLDPNLHSLTHSCGHPLGEARLQLRQLSLLQYQSKKEKFKKSRTSLYPTSLRVGGPGSLLLVQSFVLAVYSHPLLNLSHTPSSLVQ